MMVNPRKKKYMHLLYLFGIPFGAEISYENIEKLYVNRNHGVYCCYIKFKNGEKYLFDTSENKDRLIEQLLDDCIRLEAKLYDQTISPNNPVLLSG